MKILFKDFIDWVLCKYRLHISDHTPPDFAEREIWWCSVGVNVGKEIYGKGKNFRRPVLIIKKLDKDTFIGLPLTSSLRKGSWYENIKIDNRTENTIVISHIRHYDYRRLDKRILTLSEGDYTRIMDSLFNLIF